MRAVGARPDAGAAEGPGEAAVAPERAGDVLGAQQAEGQAGLDGAEHADDGADDAGFRAKNAATDGCFSLSSLIGCAQEASW